MEMNPTISTDPVAYPQHRTSMGSEAFVSASDTMREAMHQIQELPLYSTALCPVGQVIRTQAMDTPETRAHPPPLPLQKSDPNLHLHCMITLQ